MSSPHFSQGIVKQAKREPASKSRQARKARGVISRTLAFCLLYYPWAKLGIICSL